MAVVHRKRNKAERLLRAGDGAKHFCRAQHSSGASEEHQLYVRALIDRTRQGKQSTVNREYLELSGSTLTILKSKHRRSKVCQMDSGCAQLSVQLGEAVHIP